MILLAAAGNTALLLGQDSVPCTACSFSSWTFSVVLLYFLLVLSIHYRQRTLIARHKEYHVSLLELSREPGLMSNTLTKRERCGQISFTLASVCSLANVCVLFANSHDAVADGGHDLVVFVLMCVELLLSRHKVGIVELCASRVLVYCTRWSFLV